MKKPIKKPEKNYFTMECSACHFVGETDKDFMEPSEISDVRKYWLQSKLPISIINDKLFGDGTIDKYLFICPDCGTVKIDLK